MTEQEKINFETQKQLAMQDAKFAMFMHELQQQREDIRRAQEKHDADMRAAQAKHDADMKELQKRQDAAQAKHDADMKAAQTKHDADIKEIRKDMKELRNEIRDALKNLQGLTIAAMVGIAAVSVGVLGFLWSTTGSMQPQPQSIYQMPPNYQAAPEQPTQ